MNGLLSALGAALLISLVSLVGVAFVRVKQATIGKTLLYLVSFAAGGLLGGAFFHLLPEAAAAAGGSLTPFVFAAIGFMLFFTLERVLRLYHHHHRHDEDCYDEHRHLGPLNLIGDGIHNFLDGLIIMSAFAVNPGLGLAVTLSVALHELPQEMGDYGVLLYAGYSRTRALWYNFASAVLAIIGVLVGYFFLQVSSHLTSFLIPFAAGGFMYIAAADLIPELHKADRRGKSLAHLAIILAALAFMWALRAYGVE